MFDFSAKLGALPDSRQAPRHHGKKIFDAVFLGASCQFPALHRIETECHSGALSKRIGSLSEDAMGYALERQDPGAIFTLGCDLARQLKRNGIFRSSGFVHQLGRSRWVIDTEVLQTITTDGHLKKPSVHQGRGQALIVLTMIRVLAFTLTLVFFHRQVRSHLRSCSFGFCDLAHRLAYQFLVTSRSDSS